MVFGHGEGIADAPVAGAVHPDALGVAVLQHVDGAVGRAFALGIERDAGPEAVIEHMVDGVLLDVVDDDALGLDLGEVFQRIDDEARAFELVLKVRGVDEHELVVILRDLHMLLEDFQLVAAVFVQADLADAEHAGLVDELRDEARSRPRRA
jgi:hypothetical protein